MIDLVIIGGGPAGLAAAIQAARDGLKVRLLSDEAPGGLLRAANCVENFPGFQVGIPGSEIADRMCVQAYRLGVVCERARVESVLWCNRHYLVAATRPDGATEHVESRTVLAATGTRPLPWHVRGLEMIPTVAAKERIHRDVRSLPRRMASEIVCIVGGGEAAFDSALTVASRGASVCMLVRGRSARAGCRLFDRALASGIEVLTGTQLTTIGFDDTTRRLVLDEGRLTADYLIVCTGRVPDTDCFADAINGYVASGDVATARPGFFMAGDVIRGIDRFAAGAVGDGIRAARLAGRFTGVIE